MEGEHDDDDDNDGEYDDYDCVEIDERDNFDSYIIAGRACLLRHNPPLQAKRHWLCLPQVDISS